MSIKRYQKLLDEQKEAFDILYEYTDEQKAFEIVEKEDFKYLKCLGNCLKDSSLDIEESIEVCDQYLEYIDIDDPICGVFRNTEEAGREYIDSVYDLPDEITFYFDYEAFGDSLEEPYCELDSGRVVYLCM